MGRRADLVEQQAAEAAKQLKTLLKDRGRRAAKNFLTQKLKDVPRLNIHVRSDPTDEQTSEWRRKLLVKIDVHFDNYPPLLADVLELLTKAGDFDTGDWLARRKLRDAGVNVDRRGETPPDMMLREAADWGTMNTEVLLAMNDLYTQHAQQFGNGIAAAWRFDLPTYLIGRLTIGQQLGKALPPDTTLSLINSVLRLPYRRFEPQANESMLRLAVDRSQHLLTETPKETRRGKNTVSREDVWQAHLRAGIHLASHLCANGQQVEGRALFDQFNDLAVKACSEYPDCVALTGARLRLLHKWFKYEDPDPEKEFAGRPLVRTIYNSVTQPLLRKAKRGDPVDQTLLLRMARFERDAGSKALGYELMQQAVALGGTNPWPQTILQSWLATDRAPKPKRVRPAPVRPVAKKAQRHHKPRGHAAPTRRG